MAHGRYIPQRTYFRDVYHSRSLGFFPSEDARFVAARIIRFLGALLVAALGVRLLISFFGSVRSSVFGNFVYDLTHPLIVPFSGVFDKMFQLNTGRVDVATLVAMVIYTLATVSLAWLTAPVRRFRR